MLLLPALAWAQAYPSPIFSRVNLASPVTWAGGTFSAAQSAIYWQNALNGTCTNGDNCSGSILIQTDNLVASSTSAVLGLINQAGALGSGQMAALYAEMKVSTASADGANKLGAQINAKASVSDTGTVGTYAGGIWGVDIISELTNANAQFYVTNAGGEVDFGLVTGASVHKMFGWKVVNSVVGSATGDQENIGYVLGSVNGAAGLQAGYTIGSYDDYNPLNTSSGTAFCFWARAATTCGSGSFGTIGSVLDASNVTIGNFFLKSTGFTVDGSGNSVSNTLSLGGTNLSAASWGTSGLGLTGTATTFTDTSSSGTIAAEAIYALPASTLQTSNATTITNASLLYLPNPVMGGNVTGTAVLSLFAQGPIKTAASVISGGGATLAGGTISINANNNNVTNIGTGSTSSTVTLGGGSDAVTLNATTATITGTINENVNAASNTNLNSGTSSGTITIGNSGNTGKTVLAGISTGTNADFLCISAANVVLFQNSPCTISSLRFKQNIGSFTDDALARILALPVDTFIMKPTEPPSTDPNSNSKQIGLIAEDIARIEPRCAIYEDDMKTPKSYRPECMIALLVAGTQQAQAQIARLQWQSYALALWSLLLTAGVLRRRKHG